MSLERPKFTYNDREQWDWLRAILLLLLGVLAMVLVVMVSNAEYEEEIVCNKRAGGVPGYYVDDSRCQHE